MNYRTVNLKEETYRQLTLYRVAGKSFDEVIRDLIARVDHEEFMAEEIELHRKRLAEMKKGKFVTLGEMEARLGLPGGRRTKKSRRRYHRTGYKAEIPP
jgi:predicted CopG family antitoxin